ncbi:MAG: S41 family peptidase, partial [Kiritimatiellaeota bacterium]|nr:S41 family peptidase [Kiritimatiellota bacterium]
GGEAEAWRELVESANWMEGAYADIAVMAEALMVIKEHHVEEKSARELMYAAIHGMLESLDPYCAFLEPEDFAGQLEDMEGVFMGIGITATTDDEGLAVVAVTEDSPAARAGIAAGDTILSVDGVATKGMEMKDAVRAFRGPPGSGARLEVSRGGEAWEVVVERGEIEAKTVWLEMLGDGVAWVKISRFTEKTAEAFGGALHAMATLHKATAMVLDLRDNPGGVVGAAVEVAGCFLPRGATVVSTRGREDHDAVMKTSDGEKAKWPVVVLVNKNTASAAEILAGALQDHRRAVIVGEKTFGKASVQHVTRFRLRPEVGMRLTVARYFTPNGRMIQGEGIAPDIEADGDALEKAVEILKAARIFLKADG